MSIEDWAESGLAALTGHAGGAPDLTRAPVLQLAAATLARFADDVRVLGGNTTFPSADALLAGRAGLTGHRRAGRMSAGGAARLIRAADTWFALSLARPDDLDLIPALLDGTAIGDDPWAAIESRATDKTAQAWVDRARLLGLPAAVLGEAAPRDPVVSARGAPLLGRPMAGLLIVDLSSLWAGPLCTHLLHAAGATVIKVESADRPDGSRRGNRAFFDWMNSGKLSYAIDFNNDTDSLAELLSVADIVVEASRPRALRRLGLAAEQLPARPGQVWMRITAHGADDPAGGWIGFGDDAAVAGGLVGGTSDDPVFCGDAIADPLTGIVAASAIARALRAGGGVCIDVALAQVAANHTAAGRSVVPDPAPIARDPKPPKVIDAVTPASELGADNARVQVIVAERRGRSASERLGQEHP